MRKIVKRATKKELQFRCNSLVFSGPAGIQTPNLLIRSEMLYSVKLQAQNVCFRVWVWKTECKCKE
jgi:hypothetical protein